MHVNNEYGILKKCFIGLPYELHNDSENGWRTVFYSDIADECNELSKILSEYSVQVLDQNIVDPNEIDNTYPEFVSQCGCSMFFPRDCMVVIGDKCIKLGLRPEFLGMGFKGSIVEMPCCKDPDLVRTSPYIEGGDLIQTDDKIIIGLSDHQWAMTNGSGAEWLKSIIKDKQIIMQYVGSDLFHLDMVMSIVNKETILASTMIDVKDDLLSDMDVIWVGEKESLSGHINGLAITKDLYIVPRDDTDHDKSIIKALNDRGIDTISVDFKHHLHLKGGIRCATAIVERSDN